MCNLINIQSEIQNQTNYGTGSQIECHFEGVIRQKLRLNIENNKALWTVEQSDRITQDLKSVKMARQFVSTFSTLLIHAEPEVFCHFRNFDFSIASS